MCTREIKIAVYGSRRQDEMFERIAVMLDMLAARGAGLLMHAGLYDHLHDDGGLPLRGVTRTALKCVHADRALSIGGDGTFLRTVRWAGSDDTPVLGVNTGHLGYLAAYTVDEPEAVAAALLDGCCVTERRSLLELVAPARRFGTCNYALNDVAILKTDSSSMLVMHARLDNRELATYRADGLIVATPTGSTGYSLSVGGPVIAPLARNFVLSPVAAHSLTMRPLVIPDDMTITVTTDCRAENYLISLDGRCAPMHAGSTVVLRRAPFTVCVVQRSDHTFMDTLRNKLLWGQ